MCLVLLISQITHVAVHVTEIRMSV